MCVRARPLLSCLYRALSRGRRSTASVRAACSCRRLCHWPAPNVALRRRAARGGAQDGRTPLLHCCICYGNVEVATLLLECGANVEAKDNVRSSLLLHLLSPRPRPLESPLRSPWSCSPAAAGLSPSPLGRTLLRRGSLVRMPRALGADAFRRNSCARRAGRLHASAHGRKAQQARDSEAAS